MLWWLNGIVEMQSDSIAAERYAREMIALQPDLGVSTATWRTRCSPKSVIFRVYFEGCRVALRPRGVFAFSSRARVSGCNLQPASRTSKNYVFDMATRNGMTVRANEVARIRIHRGEPPKAGIFCWVSPHNRARQGDRLTNPLIRVARWRIN